MAAAKVISMGAPIEAVWSEVDGILPSEEAFEGFCRLFSVDEILLFYWLWQELR